MGKNILIFADGTGQAGGARPDQRLSNVYKLYRATRVGPDSSIDPARQVAFYDPGLGTDEDFGGLHLRPVRTLRKYASSATGLGLSTNIIDCYEAILRHYEPGDRIYLFGFSRGAYTARCVAGVLGLCGVPTRGADGSPCARYGRSLREIATEAVTRVYEHGAGKDRMAYEKQRLEQAARFRRKYGSGEGDTIVVPYFIGVFDTVAALGASGYRRIVIGAVLLALAAAASSAVAAIVWLFGVPFFTTAVSVLCAIAVVSFGKFAWSRFRWMRKPPDGVLKGIFSCHFAGWKAAFYDKKLNKGIRYARHALAIDENRADFDRVAWAHRGSVVDRQDDLPWLRQVWFAGNHSDVGGSYPEDESRLSDIALEWMLEQATEVEFPILYDESKLHHFPSADGLQHCEIESLREWLPRRFPNLLRPRWKVKAREVPVGAALHPTVYERLALGEARFFGTSRPYRPEALSRQPGIEQYYAGALAPPQAPAANNGDSQNL